MIYIGTGNEPNSSVYLDIHAIERLNDGVRVSALVGDGCYEGEVLIETGAHPEVTFADRWLGGEGLGLFLQRCGQHWLQESLLTSVRVECETRGMQPDPGGRPVRPHRFQPPASVAESGPLWSGCC